jgi:cyclopropane fatty-acyl-phospholipid synthase-like methyltransferase
LIGDKSVANSTQFNSSIWQEKYAAPNVESWVFRWWNRVGKQSVVESQGSNSERPATLDHGCGQGTAVNFFFNQGCDAYGIDVSNAAISEGKSMYPEVADKLFEIDPLLENFSPPNQKFSLVSSIQTMYYLSPDDREIVMARLKELSKPKAVFYLTMMTSVGTYFENSIELDNGMRHVKFTDDRISVDQHICFVKDENHFSQMFPMLEIIEIGQYLQSFRRSDFNHECTHLAITTKWR